MTAFEQYVNGIEVPEQNNVVENGGAKETIKTDESDDVDERNDNKHYGWCMAGVVGDLRARVPLYMDDWGRPKSVLTVLNATMFAFVVQLIPALIFAELMDKETQGSLSVAETLFSAGIIGIIYVIISGQPLVILGVTGPVAILLGTSFSLAEQFNAQYFTFFWWLCMWTALMHIIAAMVGLVNFVWIITPFTSQIFEFFIATSFMYESIRDLVGPLHLRSRELRPARSAEYATLVIGIATFYICWTLHFAETWVYFSRQLRRFLSSYNMAIAVIIVTALSYLPGVDQSDEGPGIERVSVKAPWDWKPSVDRPWVADPFSGIGVAGIFGALFPAFMLFLLFFIDHNISSILTQAPKYNLKKPPAYHWDLFCLGITIIPCGILGLPPGSGLIPQAPLHTRALATYKIVEIDGVKREVTIHVEEQRWSGLFQAALMFVALSLFAIISWIPKGCLFGVFFYLGLGAMYGNEIWERITLSCMYAKKRPPIPVVREVDWRTVQWFTLFQVACAMVIFFVAHFATVGTFSMCTLYSILFIGLTSHVSYFGLSFCCCNEKGYIFPALVTALVPVRSYIVSRFFSNEDL
jgi:boron transporter